MHLYKRGNVWWIEYVKGGKKFRSSTGTGDKKAARRWMSAIDTARKMPTVEEAIRVLKILYAEEPTSKLPLREAWDEYYRLADSVGKANVRKETMRQRKIHFDAFVAWTEKFAASVDSIEGVNGAIAAKYAAFLKSKGTKSKTRINTISDLTNVWNMLSKASVGLQNVWVGLRPNYDDGERIKAFSASQERLVLEAARKVGKDWLPICLLSKNTGLRYEDCALLKRVEVDLERRVVQKMPEKTRRHGTEVVIPMVDELYDALKDIPYTGDYFFPAHAHWYGDNSQKRQKILSFREVLKEAGLDGQGFTFHSWRHTAATRLAAAGASKETRKQILGHTTDAMAEHYDHDEHLAEKRKALEAAAAITSSP